MYKGAGWLEMWEKGSHTPLVLSHWPVNRFLNFTTREKGHLLFIRWTQSWGRELMPQTAYFPDNHVISLRHCFQISAQKSYQWGLSWPPCLKWHLPVSCLLRRRCPSPFSVTPPPESGMSMSETGRDAQVQGCSVGPACIQSWLCLWHLAVGLSLPLCDLAGIYLKWRG